MSKQTIGGITAELVQCGVPRWDEVSHHPPTAWWIFTDTTEGVEVVHIAGKTSNDEGWQLEVICCLHGHVHAVNVIEADSAVVLGSLIFWPGLPAAIEFALMVQRLSDAECCCEEEEGNA